MELVSGAVISQRYVLSRLIGEGGMGAVWAASHTVTRKHVALKFLKGHDATNPVVIKRFLREARAASAVRHPNVVQIHDILQLEDGQPVMVMDLLEGESLAGRLQRESALSLRDLAEVLAPVVSAIGTAHSLGIVHRDLKPDNIFLARSGDAIVPKVLDFGIAKLSATEGEAAATAHLTSTGAMMGTPYYMAPEQVFGEKDLDHRADIWALGVILYEGLSGRRPVDGDNLGQLIKVITTGAITPLVQLAPHLPADVLDLVGRMLSTDRAARLPQLGPALDILRHYASAEAPSFAMAAPVQRPPDSQVLSDLANSATVVASADTAPPELRTGMSSVNTLHGATRPAAASRWPMVLGGLAVVGLSVGGAALVVTRVARAPEPAAVTTPAPVPQASLTAGSPVVTPAALEIAPASAPASASAVAAPTAKPGGKLVVAAPAPAPAPAPAAATTAKPPERQRGSVVSETPF